MQELSLRNSFIFVPFGLLALLFSNASVHSQGYPRIPAAIQEAANLRMAVADKRSDDIFAQALPTILEWEKNGKPYIPSAEKPEDLPQAKIPAFPGAEGGGMYSFGGRLGKVLIVSNINDSGRGSFREACETAGPRTIVFNVSGIIQIKDRIRIRAPYITIAGSTAPGDGVCIAGNTVELETHDIIIRHMRFRRGATDATDRNDSFGGNPIGNVMIDHVSASWGLDENMSMYRHMYQPPDGSKEQKLPTVNITIQNSIFSEALNTYHHAFGSTIGGLNSTFHHNLWACNTGRNPSVGMYGDFTFVNNVLFNYRHRTIDGGDQRSYFNIINNYFKPGPGTPSTAIAYRILKPESERSKVVFDNFGKAYVAGNMVEGYPRVSADNWDGGVQPDSKAPVDEVLPKIRVNEPFPHAPLTMDSPQVAFENVLANAGATLPKRDAVDLRIIQMVRTGIVPPIEISSKSAAKAVEVGYAPNWVQELVDSVPKGFITDPLEVGGYPNYQGTPHIDSDSDGMPDEWEKQHRLDPNNPLDANHDQNGDGYTNIEEYINGTTQSQVLHFAATGCGPYAPDEEPLLEHYVDLVNRDGKSEFLVHLGDVVSGSKRKWPESQYATVANILRKSKRPVFVVLGDNEWNDLDTPDEGLEFWNRQFRNFDEHFLNAPKPEKQKSRPENFAFVSKGVLVIGLNIVGGKVHDKAEWAIRLQQDADWVAEQFALHKSGTRAAVLLAQATPAGSHELFFKQLVESCKEWVKPVLYLHADGHVWQVEKAWRAPNLWRVQTDQVRLNPPVLVTVTEDPNNPFTFDRRLDIGSRRELFVDDFLIDQHSGTTLKLHAPEPKDVALVCDAPWEGNTSAYYTLFADGDRFRMVYRGAHFDEKTKKSAHPEYTCYAESQNGIQWVKPKLSIVEFQGSAENNIILAGEGTHNFTPFLDTNPDCLPDAKYKALAGDSKGLKAYKSADAIHWSLMRDKPVITKGDFDSQNLAFWHPLRKQYVAYHRKGREGIRDIMTSVSANFLSWNEPSFLAYGDAPSEHLYTNAIQPYFRAPHLLVAFPTRFQPEHEQVEPIFMTSRDGLSFKRWSQVLIPTTAPKDRSGNRSNYMTNGLLQLPGQDRELSVYATEAYYAGPGSRVRRFALRTDGFVSVHADSAMSEFVTKPFTFSGGQLKVNFVTGSGGSIRFELQDEEGRSLEGYSLANSTPLVGDQIEQGVSWMTKSNNPATENSSVEAFQNKPVRLRVAMQYADLYSMRFAE